MRDRKFRKSIERNIFLFPPSILIIHATSLPDPQVSRGSVVKFIHLSADERFAIALPRAIVIYPGQPMMVKNRWHFQHQPTRICVKNSLFHADDIQLHPRFLRLSRVWPLEIIAAIVCRLPPFANHAIRTYIYSVQRVFVVDKNKRLLNIDVQFRLLEISNWGPRV